MYGRCGICGNHEFLVRDHSHRSGLDRRRICNHCNLALGHFKDRPMAMIMGAIYVALYDLKHFLTRLVVDLRG